MSRNSLLLLSPNSHIHNLLSPESKFPEVHMGLCLNRGPRKKPFRKESLVVLKNCYLFYCPSSPFLLIPDPEKLQDLGENVWLTCSPPQPPAQSHTLLSSPARGPGLGSFLPSAWGKQG
jgi:hypothetical protein